MSMKSHGFRSNFELNVAQQLVKKKIAYDYEKHPIQYIKECTYTPDFYLKKYGFFVEVKGQFTASDRGKHLLIKKQQPELDIRLLFLNANSKLYKGSKTTYGRWCDRYDIKWCDKFLPKEWLDV